MTATSQTKEQTPVQENIEEKSISQTIRTAYLAYSMETIRARALPDVRDGLKPVHRRILYSMFESGFTQDKPYRKSARAVGDTMGKYHPHGDASIYDALVIMGQSWSTNRTLIDPQGNFGNIDGDKAAAMRYTEARLSGIAMTLFRDIGKDTIDWESNYDDTEREPTVLPAPFPNLVVNGSTGIATGIASKIPPHNLRETIAATCLLLDNPDIPTKDLCDVIKGPDMPTRGIIHGASGFHSAVETGAGRIYNRARHVIEQRGRNTQSIVITEIPYQTSKSTILLNIRDLVIKKKIEGIVDLSDESTKKLGMRIVIAVKNGYDPETILAQLFRLTPLEISYNYNCTVIENDNPVQKGLRHLILAWIQFRRDTVIRRTRFELEKKQNEEHIYLGYQIAINALDDVLDIIRKSKDTPAARQALMTRLNLSEIQSNEILALRLSRLTGMEIDQIVKNLETLSRDIKHLQKTLDTPHMIDNIIKKELHEIDNLFGHDRLSEITDTVQTITHEETIKREDVVIMLTEQNYIKRLPLSAIQNQGDNTRGKAGITVAEGDRITFLHQCHSHDLIAAITTSGQMLGVKAYEVPETPTNSRGRHINNIIADIEDDIATVIILPEINETEEDGAENPCLVSVSKNGQIRRSELSEFSGATRKGGIRALKFSENDGYAACFVANAKDDIILTSSNGKTIRFNLESVSFQSRAGTGVAGIKTDHGDAVIGADIIPNADNTGQYVLVIGQFAMKKTPADDIEPQSRGGKGNYLLRPSKKVGDLVRAMVSTDTDTLVLIQNNDITRLNVGSIETLERAATQSTEIPDTTPQSPITNATIVTQKNDADEADVEAD